MSNHRRLRESIHRDVRRLAKRERSPADWLEIAFLGGAAGLLFIVPILLGTYLGRWLDGLASGYSVRWTVSLIVLGIVLGAWNVYNFMRGRR